MQKTLDILERNVQWIALGLGGIFLLWSVYSYVITPPAVVTINNKKVGPGDVAIITNDVPAKNVQVAMNDNAGIHIDQLNVAQAFDAAMSGANQTAVASVPAWSIGMGAKLGAIDSTKISGPKNGETRIAALPVLPPAQVVSAQAGLSVVQLPEANNNQANPNARNRNNNAAVQQVAQLEDTEWVGVFFKVPADAFQKAFQAPLNGQTPAGYVTTMFEVKVERQQAEGIDPTTNQPIWPKDNEKVESVPALKIYRSDLKQMPSESAPKNQKYEYWEWAKANPQLVYTPEFYQITGGTPPPDIDALYTGNGNNAAAPNNAAGGADNGAPQDNATQPAAPATQPAAPASGQQTAAPANETRTLAAANPNWSYAPEDNRRFSEEEYRNRYTRNGGRVTAPTGRPEMGGRFNPRNVPMPGRNFNQNAAAGAGEIDPLNMADDLRIWAYDETAKPGQIYRYRIVYKVSNPLFGTTNLADPKLAEQFALASPPSDWTGPVTVPEKTKFWLATLNGNQARMDIFTIDQGANGQGEWKVSKQSLTPGDQVPGTDWTLVDVRGEATRERDHYVLLTSDTGQMSKRDLNTDRGDPQHQDMLNQTNPNNGENPAGTAPPPPSSGRRPLSNIPPSRGGYRGR